MPDIRESVRWQNVNKLTREQVDKLNNILFFICFLVSLSTCILITYTMHSVLCTVFNMEDEVDVEIGKGETFVCIGDSITDCNRRDSCAPLGFGYVKMFNDMLLAISPQKQIKVINKGISGDTTRDLKGRWGDDVIYHKPQWLSVLIGINNVHRVRERIPIWKELVPENYERDYRMILERTSKLKCNIILMEPFYISTDNGDQWRKEILKDLQVYRRIVWKLSKEFKTKLIKLHDIFGNGMKFNDPETFAPEPVHPNLTGHQLIAMSLLEAVSK